MHADKNLLTTEVFSLEDKVLDARIVLEEFHDAISSRPSLERLEEIREAVSKPWFRREILAQYLALNDYDSLHDAVTRLRQKAEDLSRDRSEDKSVMSNLAVGGGVSVIGGALVGAATISTGGAALLLLPIVGGFAAVGVGYAGSRSLNRESYLLEDIAEHISYIESDIRRKNDER